MIDQMDFENKGKFCNIKTIINKKNKMRKQCKVDLYYEKINKIIDKTYLNHLMTTAQITRFH